MLRLILSVAGMVLFCSVHAQQIKGVIVDENDHPLEFASVLLLNQKDSSMINFANSKQDGAFSIHPEQQQSGLLQITYVGFETKWVPLSKINAVVDLGKIQLRPSSQLLGTIVVKDNMSPMVIGKDTVQYNAGAFKVKVGDVAEDLLRKLPGVEVERDGSVKAFGEKVENVLVDGKSFFGKDTKIATKNLDADAIDKVQVFDKKSDRAEFTGIQDGQQERTINLKLKEDKKVGYFGTAEVAGGTTERFKARANINRFTPSSRISFIGMANNINEQNFSISDYIDFMGGIGAFMAGGAGKVSINLDQNSGLPIGLGNNQGVQRSFAGGANFSTDFTTKTSFEGSAFSSNFKNTLNSNSFKENIWTDRRFITQNQEDQSTTNNSGSFNFKLKSKLDSTQNLILKGSGNIGNNYIASLASGQSFTSEQSKLNENNNNYRLNGNNVKVSSDLTWQKKLRKKGRSIYSNLSTAYSDANNDGVITSQTRIYFPVNTIDKINQNQTATNKGLNYQLMASYTEPLGKRRYLEGVASASNQVNLANTGYFDIINDAPVKNNLLSTIYQRDYWQRNAGVNFSKSATKYNYTLGAKYQVATLKGDINEAAAKIRGQYQAVLPNAFFDYQFAPSVRLDMDYTTDLNVPSLIQLQPTINNSNPLSIYIGNPDLRPEYIHAVSGSYMNYNAYNFSMFFASLRLSYNQHKITEALTIDSSLVRLYTPVNTKYETNVSTRVEYSTPLRPLPISAKIVCRANYAEGFALVNAQSNTTKRPAYGVNLSLENRRKEIVDFLVGAKLNQSYTIFSNNSNLNQNYLEQTLYNETNINIGDWVTLKSRFDWTNFRQSFSTQQYSVQLWNLTLSSFLSKTKKLRLSLTVFDLLNQNKGINRNSTLNYTEVLQTNVLGRYFMLGLSYNIKGFKKKDGLEVKIGS